MRRWTKPVLLACMLAACADSTAEPAVPGPSSSTDPPLTVEPEASSTPTPTIPAEDAFTGLDAARTGNSDGLPEPLVPLTELRSGGPPPDGIPSIDRPVFDTASEVNFLADNEPVLTLTVDGETRAYPVQILIWHEIVNDTVAGTPVTVTYCPLCNSAVAYDRRLGGRVLTFGVSGLLLNSSMVMFDRETESLWSHFTGGGIVGELTGEQLRTIPVATVPWAQWRDAHPDALVLSRRTGFERDYGRNPYPGYDDVNNQPFLFEGEVDGRYTAMTRVVGLGRSTDAVAVPFTNLQAAGVLALNVGSEPVVLLWTAGAASPLDANGIADGVDIGATGVFDPRLDGNVLEFRADGDGFVDSATSSRWNLLGQAVDGPLTGSELIPIEHLDTFWFAWVAFWPDTAVLP